MPKIFEPFQPYLTKGVIAIGCSVLTWGGVSIVSNKTTSAVHEERIAVLEDQQADTKHLLSGIQSSVSKVETSVAVINERTKNIADMMHENKADK